MLLFAICICDPLLHGLIALQVRCIYEHHDDELDIFVAGARRLWVGPSAGWYRGLAWVDRPRRALTSLPAMTPRCSARAVGRRAWPTASVVCQFSCVFVTRRWAAMTT